MTYGQDKTIIDTNIITELLINLFLSNTLLFFIILSFGIIIGYTLRRLSTRD